MEKPSINIEAVSDIEKKNQVFKEIIVDKLINAFVRELEEFGFDNEQINDFSSSVAAEKDDNYLLNILAIPKEIRQRWIIEAKDKKMSGADLFFLLKNKYEMIVDMQGGKKPIVGFHTSEEDISYQKNDAQKGWQIEGTEQSDLGEGLLAYASDSYESLYKERTPEFLYVVRILDTDKKYGEKETSWYWSRNFPIVEKLELNKIESELSDRLSEDLNKKAA